MLEPNDLKAIAALLDERFETVDKRFEEMDKRFETVDKRFTETEDRITKEMDKRFAETEKKIIKEIDTRIGKSENLLLLEMDRDRKFLERRIDTLARQIEELEQHAKIERHDENMADLLLSMIDELRKEMEELKEKIA